MANEVMTLTPSRRGRRDWGDLTRGRVFIVAIQLGLVVAVLTAWEFLPRIKALQESTHLLNPFFISSPSRIGERLLDLFTGRNGSVMIWPFLRPTLVAAMVGASVGLTLGGAAGLVLSNSPLLSRVFRPFLVAMNAIPRVALIPIVILLVGPEFSATIIMSLLVVFFIAFFNAYEGGISIPPQLLENARLLGADRRNIMRHIRLPYVAAWTLAALPLALTFAILSVVTAEVMSGYPGIGRLLMVAITTTESSLTFSLVIVLSLLGVSIVMIAEKIKKRLLHWWGKG